LAANIDPAQLLATASPVVSPLGGPTPVLNGTFSGFVDGQTLAALEAAGYQATWTSSVSDASASGHYAITGSFNDRNYSVVQAAGNATAFDATLAASSITSTSGSVLSTIASLSGAGGSAAEGMSANGMAANSLSASGLSAISSSNSDASASASGLVGGMTTASAGSQGEGGMSTGSSGTNTNSSGTSANPAGTSASTGNGTGLSLGADSTTTSSDGTVTLIASAVGSANTGGASSSDAGMADSAGSAALGIRHESLSDFGGRRLIVVSGGVNSSLAR
jgi:hypothetical protein